MAAKTYSTLITESREVLQDTNTTTQRYSDSTLLNVLNRGLHDLSVKRPDAFYDLYAVSDLTVPRIVEESPGSGEIIWTAVFGLEMQFYNPLVNYVVGVAEIFDDEYTDDGRAAMLLQQFRAQLLGI